MGVNNEESLVYEKFSGTMSFKDIRYEVQLPWRSRYPKLADNFELSKRWLTGLLHQLCRSPQLLQEYNAIIHNQLSRALLSRYLLRPLFGHDTSHVTQLFGQTSEPQRYGSCTMPLPRVTMACLSMTVCIRALSFTKALWTFSSDFEPTILPSVQTLRRPF